MTVYFPTLNKKDPVFLDLYLAHSYFENTDVWWGVLTLLIIAVPGTMGKGVFSRTIIETYIFPELLGYSIYLGKGEVTCCEWMVWAVLFGPIFFPFSLVLWHMVKICKGKDSFNQFPTLARSHILNNMTVLTKNCMQLVLQVGLKNNLTFNSKS